MGDVDEVMSSEQSNGQRPKVKVEWGWRKHGRHHLPRCAPASSARPVPSAAPIDGLYDLCEVLLVEWSFILVACVIERGRRSSGRFRTVTEEGAKRAG